MAGGTREAWQEEAGPASRACPFSRVRPHGEEANRDRLY